jgi:hypothetical protein
MEGRSLTLVKCMMCSESYPKGIRHRCTAQGRPGWIDGKFNEKAYRRHYMREYMRRKRERLKQKDAAQ